MTNIDDLLTAIARKHLGFETLETRRSGSLDFREVAVWTVKDALTAAYEAGIKPLAEGDIESLLSKRRQVAVIWSIEDVQQVRPDLNDDQAWEVLEEARNLHDCEYGFTWTHLEIVADNMYPKLAEIDSSGE